MSRLPSASAPLRVFLSGVVQGSRRDSGHHSQDYRQRLRRLLEQAHPEAEVVCPVELNPGSGGYDEALARQAFLAELELAASCDVTIAYAPVATMGTAVEMFQAFSAGKSVFAISPMAENWAIRFLSTRVFPDFKAFEDFVAAGGLACAFQAHRTEALAGSAE